jgi:hypothetical protein
MKRKAITFLWMSISCLLVFTVLSLGYAESEISSADSASVFISVIDEFRAAIHDPHYDSICFVRTAKSSFSINMFRMRMSS